MKLQMRLIVVLVGFVLGAATFLTPYGRAGQSKTASIKKRNGEAILGQIRGLIVQKVEEDKIGEDGKKIYSAKYVLTNGTAITAIDEDGVHAETFIAMFHAGSYEPLDDGEIVNSALTDPGFQKGGLIFGITGKIGLYASADALSYIRQRMPDLAASIANLSRWPLVGEFRKRETEGKPQIVSALEIGTDKGVLTIPVNEIVEFKIKADKTIEKN